MPGAKPTLGYPSRTAAVMALLDEGLNYDEIAARIGISTNTVRSLENDHLEKIAVTRIRCKLVNPHSDYMRKAARLRGITASQLAHHLLEIICEDDLLLSILDDGHDDA